MSRHIEPLTEGLFTGPDPALLGPGQLSYIQNAVYKPSGPALRRARGRAVFCIMSATGTDVVGLRDLKFDSGDHYLVSMQGGAAGTYVICPVEGAYPFGVATSLVSGFVAGNQLEKVHFRNRYYLLNGVTADSTAKNTNLVIYQTATAASQSPTYRQHGMLPVRSSPYVDTSAGVFSQTVTGYYEYWTTEVAKFTADGGEQVMESTFIGAPTTYWVSALSMVPVIKLPTVNNTLTTNWRVYRSAKKDLASDKLFPAGFMIAEVGTATGSVADTLTTATATALPSAYNSAGAYSSWSNPSAMYVSGANYSSAAVAALGAQKGQGLYGFGLSFAGSVKGIEVELGAQVSGASAVPIEVFIGPRDADGGFLNTSRSWIPLRRGAGHGVLCTATASTMQTLTVGSSADRWLPADQPPFTDTEMTNGNFMVAVNTYKPNTSAYVDYVKLRAYYAATVDGVVQFPSVVYTFGDISAQVGKNGPPPCSSTGDMFEGCMVLNDTTSPSLLKWSAPDDPDSFPATYFMKFDTDDNDQITLIKVVNSRLMVGLNNSIWRVNYLPSERDASFDRGKAKEPLSRTFGVVNPMCACVFSPDGPIEKLAFVSKKGIHVTDGYSFQTLTNDLDWRGIISTTSVSQCIALVNDPENMELLFYYRNESLTPETCKCLHLSYAPRHYEGGQLKISGPVNMRNYVSGDVIAPTGTYSDLKSAWTVPRLSGDTSVFLGFGGGTTSTAAGAGKVFIETGSNISARDSSYGYITRRMYLAGQGNEWRLNELYQYIGYASGTQSWDYTPMTVKTNDSAGEVTGSVASRAVASGMKLHKVQFRNAAEGMRISAFVTAGHDDTAPEYLILDGEGFGAEDSGK